ncbi:MAG: SpoIIE family protein phosphatase [Candidatus Omnitrophica bacterium]|nr:SpoIIE family protein phosphatase [Candidatus Omnitrophota bacterium]
MAYQHVEVESQQSSKHPGTPCGDTFLVKRTIYHTTIILADGIGSGIKAHIASQMNTSRMSELLDGGVSLRDAFFSVVGTMSKWRDHTMPFAAFLVMRILNDGMTILLKYEMPQSVLLNRKRAVLIPESPLVVPAGLSSESYLHLHPGEGILLMSDGITQAGMGTIFSRGWSAEGVEGFLSRRGVNDINFSQTARDIIQKAQEHDKSLNGDDKTVLLAHMSVGCVVDVLTGPPTEKTKDAEVAAGFLSAEGAKVVCGATTADIVAKYSGTKVEVEQRPASYSTPPRYFINGIDLVTEGAVTLTQTYNIIEEEGVLFQDKSAAADLAALLQKADFIRFTVGKARNPANADIVYRKQGILPREKIVPLLAQKLERMGKLVTVAFV